MLSVYHTDILIFSKRNDQTLSFFILGFEVDFQPDADALDSILNGKGIERLPRSPPFQNNNKNNSVLGPVKNVRTRGRVVPFSRPSAAGRLNGNGGRKIPVDNQGAVNDNVS